MNYYLAAWKKYATFSGRAQRAEYWVFTLINLAIIVAGIALGEVFGDKRVIPVVVGAFILAMLIPSIAVTVRRLHDTEKNGWWIFIKLVPLVGSIVLLIFLLDDSQLGDNKYGPNPKGVQAQPQIPQSLSNS